MPIRVVVIDDSPTMLALLKMRLEAEHDICVVGTAGNAAQGREAIRQLDPDVVTLDIEMPGMNGLDFLQKIMALRPTPVIIVSGATKDGDEIAARALALGAVDCCAKSACMAADDGGRLADLVRTAAQARYDGRTHIRPDRHFVPPVRHAPRRQPMLIAIGSSTGGVEALQTMLAGFPADCPPTVIVQHVNVRFASAIATTLGQASAVKVQLAEPEMPLEAGNVYLAPGGTRHLQIGGRGPFHAKLRPGERVSGHQPSVDALFLSVAQSVGPNATGVLLTGMGRDGARGLLAMARAGAQTIAQDEASCTVFGMPRAAIELGAAASVLPLGRITRQLFQGSA